MKEAFLLNLADLKGLGPETKQKISEKINNMQSLIAFGDHYQAVSLDRVSKTNYLQNFLNLSQNKFDATILQLGRPIDKAKWDMQPYHDNAYYNRESNLIVLPYLNLVPPYFDSQGTDAANLGSIAYVAHELTHGFDASGSQYDGNGNISKTWTESEYEKLKQLNQCYIEQANNYKVVQGFHLNGELILDENIADQGGLKMAYLAYKKELSQQKFEMKKIEGTENFSSYKTRTSDQEFFLAYAQTWCAKETDLSIKNQIDSDEHAPNEFRVNGVLMNRPEFAKAFNCPVGSKLNPVQRCETW